MDLPSEDVEIPMPLNTTYPSAHAHQHQHHDHEHVVVSNSKKKQGIRGGGEVIMYRECMRNHAASMGGNARDGCGEFMPSGEQGSIEALSCSACNCHRNFHRKEVEGDDQKISSSPPLMMMINNRGRKVIQLGHHKSIMMSPTTTAGALVGGSRSVPIIPYNMGSLWIPSDHHQSDGGVAYMGSPPPPPPPPQPISSHHNQMVKKRSRTKFTQQQKEKMLEFAEKVGWKIQKLEESVVQHFCKEIGVKRRVLKVWMHNNKHNLANNKHSSTPKSPMLD